MIHCGKTTAHAPGKVILVGEHSVVHGHPGIALPFPALNATATVTPKAGPLRMTCALWEGEFEAADDVPAPLLGLAQTAIATLQALDLPTSGLEMRLETTLPIGRGLGSGAAIAVALVRALAEAPGRAFSLLQLLSLVQIAEDAAHGRSSGIDAATVAQGAPLWFVPGSEPEVLRLSTPLHLVVADTGRARDTRAAVTAVQACLQSSPQEGRALLAALGETAHLAKTALSTGDTLKLGQAMNRAQQALASLGVSDEGLDGLLSSARLAGALGAKLTGAGRGGCLLALAEDASHQAQLAAALLKAGAAAAWPFTPPTALEN